MSDSLSAAAQPVRVQGKLSGLCYENTVIDRKGRIRKVKPPTAKKPDFGPTSHQKLDDHHHQQQQHHHHHHHHHRPSVPQKNFDRSPGARLEDLFDNRSFVIGNNNVDYAMHQQQQQQQQQQLQQQQQQQQQQEQQQAWYDQQLSDMDRRHREQIWWRERPSSKSASNTRNSYDDVAIPVVPNRPEKPQIPTKHSRSQQTDNNYNLRSKESSRKTDKNSASQSVEGTVQNPGHGKHGHANKGCEFPNARRIQRAEDTSALARDTRQGAVDPRDALGYRQASLFQYPGGDAVVNDVLRGVNDYREVLARNANLNWTPQRIQKHNIKKIDNVVFNNNNGNRFQPISNNNSDNNDNNDVYEIALNRLEAAVDDDTEDDDNDDEDRNAGFSQRSESPDTLVERILENVDETGMIVDLVVEEPAAASTQGTAKRSSTRLQASKKSFSDEILERLDSPDQDHSDAVPGPRSGYDTRQSRTLEPVRKLRSSTDRSNKYQKSKDTNSLADCNNTIPTTQLNPHFIRQQKTIKTSDNIGFDYPSLQTSPAAFPPPSAESPLFSGPHLTLQEPRFFDNGRPTREPSPEEVFEEIMESIHDTEEDYDEPFFLQWPSLLGRKGESLTRDGSGKNSVDYSIENDWLSFFYCNRVASDKIASMAPSSSSEGSQSTGIFLNSSLSSSWIESKPSRSSTLPRTSSRPEPSGAAAAIFTPNAQHSEAGTTPNNSRSSNNHDSWNDLEKAQVVEMERTPGRIDGEVASESDKVFLPKVVTSQARDIDYSPGRKGTTLDRLEGEQVEDRLPGGHQKEEEDLAGNNVQQPDAKDLLFAALDSACVRNMELNSGLQEAARTVIRLEEDEDRPPVKTNEGPGADDLMTNAENSVVKQQHHEKEIAGLSESQAAEHLGKCGEFLEYSVVDSNDANAETPEANFAPETEMSQSLVSDQERPVETTDRTSAVAFIDEEETTLRNALLDTINECDDDDEDSKQSKDKDDEVASEPVDGDGRPDPPGSARNCDEKSTSGLVTAEEEEEEVEIPGSVLQPPSTRSVQVISDEVTSQTVVLKIAWPSGKNRERGASSRKDQPFRELQLRRTIRMSEPSSKTPTTGNDERSGNDEEDSSRKKRTSEVVTSQVLPQNRKPSDAMTSPADVIVEYENRNQSRTAEALDAATSVDVTQTDSVRVLLVPATASYAVPDLKEIVAAVGQTILQDSGRIPASSNIRVTCEAVQSKSCAALKEHEDITIINDTIFDTTKSIEDACK